MSPQRCKSEEQKKGFVKKKKKEKRKRKQKPANEKKQTRKNKLISTAISAS